jgi:hypothetical protein
MEAGQQGTEVVILGAGSAQGTAGDDGNGLSPSPFDNEAYRMLI